MFYKPKYCCNCSEKIERVKWNLTASRRFCQLCETEFYSLEWSPRIIVALGLIIGIVGIGGYFQKSEKPLKIAAGSLAKVSSPVITETSNQMRNAAVEANSNLQSSVQPAANSIEQRRGQTLASLPPQAKNAQPAAPENQLNSAEAVYFCGAATKKSTACSRRVKGGGRCWQHVGQPPILPPEKLIASR